MYCKQCGHQNPKDAKFCMNCGVALETTTEPPVTISKDNNSSSEVSVNTPNAFQRILVLVSLVWFIVGLFYIPFKYYRDIVFDVLWSDRDEKIDLTRAILQFGFLFLITFFVYRYLNRFNRLDKKQYKKLAKRELVFYLIFLFSLFSCGIYLFGKNYINKERNESLTVQIAPLEQRIEKNSKKWTLRQLFWDANYEEFDVSQFEGRVNRLWDRLLFRMDDDKWMTKYYNSFTKKTALNDDYNILQEKIGVSSPVQLKEFLKNNTLNEQDFKNAEENKTLGQQLNKLRDEKAQLTFYSNQDIRRISLLVLLLSFVVIYLIRPLFWFIKGLFTEIK